MPYTIRKQKCKQADGDSGSYTLSYTDNKGKKHRACHTSRKRAQGQIAAIEGPRREAAEEPGLPEISEGYLSDLVAKLRASEPGAEGPAAKDPGTKNFSTEFPKKLVDMGAEAERLGHEAPSVPQKAALGGIAVELYRTVNSLRPLADALRTGDDRAITAAIKAFDLKMATG